MNLSYVSFDKLDCDDDDSDWVDARLSVCETGIRGGTGGGGAGRNFWNKFFYD